MTEKDIKEHKKLIEGEVRRFARNPKFSDLKEDMISTGWLGLMDAKSRYNPGRGSFESFARYRIRGAIIDSLRELDVISRHQRNFKKEAGKAKTSLYLETGQEPDPKVVAGKLGLELEKYWRLSSYASVNLVSIDMLGADTITDHDSDENPEKAAADAILKAKLDALISQLTDQERMVINLYYYQEKTMKEIGVILGKTEPRISQIHAQAIKELHRMINEALLPQPISQRTRKSRMHTVKMKTAPTLQEMKKPCRSIFPIEKKKVAAPTAKISSAYRETVKRYLRDSYVPRMLAGSTDIDIIRTTKAIRQLSKKTRTVFDAYYLAGLKTLKQYADSQGIWYDLASNRHRRMIDDLCGYLGEDAMIPFEQRAQNA